MRVLIVGSPDDPHVAIVLAELARRGSSSVVVSLGRSGNQTSPQFVTISPTNGKVLSSSVKISEVEARDFRSVYYRPKPSFATPTSVHEFIRREFVEREWGYFFEPIWKALTHLTWVNPLSAVRACKSKLFQLQAAGELEIKVPKTIVTNEAGALRGFLATTGGECIFKTHGFFFMPPDKIAFTSVIKSCDVDRIAEELAICPGIFQEVVPKLYELRVTVVGDKLFPVAIHSQEHGNAKFDWRKAIDEVRYSEAKLTQQQESAILSLQRRLGLSYGAYDFIVTPSGDFVFLEVNSSGNYLWLEEKLGLPITSEIVNFLLHER